MRSFPAWRTEAGMHRKWVVTEARMVTLVVKMRQYKKDNRNQGSWDKSVASCYNLTDIAVGINACPVWVHLSIKQTVALCLEKIIISPQKKHGLHGEMADSVTGQEKSMQGELECLMSGSKTCGENASHPEVTLLTVSALTRSWTVRECHSTQWF